MIAYGHEWLASEHVDRIITTYIHAQGYSNFLIGVIVVGLTNP